ncbi:MAG: NapC/NirT family cytochrome c [Planctomycetota bacterium]
MSNTLQVLSALVAVTAAMVVIVLARPKLLRRSSGRAMAFIAFFVLPLVITYGGTRVHLEGAKSTQFCLSCHEMEPFGQSLHLEDKEYLPATHFQSRLVPREQACFTCHTEYTLFGGLRAKLRGLNHVYVHYLGTPPAPKDIKLYEPYSNRECMHCHEGSRKYLEIDPHREEAAGIASGKLRCMECHEKVHAPGEVADLPKWEPPK